jgi:HSP20 family protein
MGAGGNKMARIPKDLLSRLDYFHAEVEELFQRLFGDELGTGFEHEAISVGIDLIETDDEFVIRVDLPGVDRDKIELHAAPNFFLLHCEKIPEEIPINDCLRIERSFGEIQRLLPLPAAADVVRVTASYKLGVLEVRLPKIMDRRKHQKRIEIT